MPTGPEKPSVACSRKHREKSELPYPFACTLRASLQSGASDARDRTARRSNAHEAEAETSVEPQEAQVVVEVSALEETFSGEIVVGRWLQPLHSRKITGYSSASREEDGGRERRQAMARMSLQEAISTANAQLKVGILNPTSKTLKP